MSRASLTDEIVERLRQRPDAILLSAWSAQDEAWSDLSVRDFHRSVTEIAKGLIAQGVLPGDRIVLRSRTRHEWTVVDYAIWWAGAITVPLYETSTTDHGAWVVADSGAKFAVVESDAGDLRLPTWTIEPSDASLDALAASGRTISDDELETRRAAVSAADVATIIYTSGTTGTPKGCPLTHANLRAEIDDAVERLPEIFGADDAATLLFLPLAHVFARIIQIGAINTGVRLGLTSDVSALPERLWCFQADVHPHHSAGPGAPLQLGEPAGVRGQSRRVLRPRGPDRDRLQPRPRPRQAARNAANAARRLRTDGVSQGARNFR